MYSIHHVDPEEKKAYRWNGWCDCPLCCAVARQQPGWDGTAGVQHRNEFDTAREAIIFATRHFDILNLSLEKLRDCHGIIIHEEEE